jgi:pimeloyl-ACP methyl ester carboxylesterase
MRWRRDLASGAAVVLGTAAAGWAAGRAVVRADERRAPPGHDAELDLPVDLRHREVAAVDGGRLHVVERGEGEPSLLVHGVTLSVRTWTYQLHDVPAGRRVLALDLRGHGASRPGASGVGIDAMADDLAAVLEELGLEGVRVVGHSLGGMVLLRFARRHPDVLRRRVLAVVLVATTASFALPLPGGRRAAGALARASGAGGGLLGRVAGATLPGGDAGYLAARLGFGTRPRPDHVALTRDMVRAADPAVLAALLPEIVRFDERGVLGRLELPATVLVGTHDRILPPSAGRRLAEELPGASLEMLRGAGHMLMLERRDALAVALGWVSPGAPRPAAVSAPR